MFLKATLQKESSNQSLHKVSSEAGARRGFFEISQYLQENICVGVSF